MEDEEMLIKERSSKMEGVLRTTLNYALKTEISNKCKSMCYPVLILKTLHIYCHVLLSLTRIYSY